MRLLISLILGVQLQVLPLHFVAHKSADFHAQSGAGALEQDCGICTLTRSNTACEIWSFDLPPGPPDGEHQLFFISTRGLALAVVDQARGPPSVRA